MKITIRPDPDCIELIRSEFTDIALSFLKSLGVPEKEADNWESTHLVEIIENLPTMFVIFEMRCFLPEILYEKSEWVFKIAKNNLFNSFIIVDQVVCCRLLNTGGLKQLPENLLNLNCNNYKDKRFNDDFNELKNLHALRSISFQECSSLTDISPICSLTQLQSLNLSNCEYLTDISPISALTQLQSLDLNYCRSLTDMNPLSALTQLQHLDLGFWKSLTDINPLSTLTQLQSLNLSGCGSLNDINPLSVLIQLQSLNLSGCGSLTDISPLSTLTQLQSLNLNSCTSLTDIRPLSGLTQLQSLNLSNCKSLTDISPLSGLNKLQSLDLRWCDSLIDISPLSASTQLQSLNLSWCDSLTDISPLLTLTQLQSLDLSTCKSLTDISPLSALTQLQSLNLSNCKSLTDISPLLTLTQLQSLDLVWCDLHTNISPLSALNKLQSLDLSYCAHTDISPLSALTQLQSLNLSNCKSLTDISPLSALTQLQSLDLSNYESLSEINGLSGLVNLQKLDLSNCKRIQNYSPLRNCLSLRKLEVSNLHPAESAELLCNFAVQRKDIPYISKNSKLWLKELKLGLNEKHSISNNLACSLAKGIVLENLSKRGLSFHQTLLEHHDVGIKSWKIWFSENLKAFGWNKIKNLAELKQPGELTFGAIAGISSCLPSTAGEADQVAWSKKWILQIYSIHKNNPNFLKPAAAEWCLGLKRLEEDQLLKEWIGKFTDPSDPSALDPINKVFSDYTLKLNDRESTLEYALKINDPSLRDQSILNLANLYLEEKETSQAGDFLFLLTEVDSRTKLAISLANDAGYLKNDENAHRLLAACGDNPKTTSIILNKIQASNPDSKILKIMHDKLGGESLLTIPLSSVLDKNFRFTNLLLSLKDPAKLTKILETIEFKVNSH